MTKQEFIEAVAERANLSQRDAAVAVDAVLASITEALRDGDAITFAGFGKFAAEGPHARSQRLWRAADELRRDAERLDQTQASFRDRLAGSRRALREIAEAP
jgi:DNA-binding protein HU-beta